jgi:hypothetical protein
MQLVRWRLVLGLFLVRGILAWFGFHFAFEQRFAWQDLGICGSIFFLFIVIIIFFVAVRDTCQNT